MKERKSVTRATAERYRGAGKKRKGRILDEFTVLTGYNRSYARYVLRRAGRVKAQTRNITAGPSPPRKKQYDEGVLIVLRKVWKTMDYICGKRLAPVLGETVRVLERFGEITLDDESREKLGRISAATFRAACLRARERSIS